MTNPKSAGTSKAAPPRPNTTGRPRYETHPPSLAKLMKAEEDVLRARLHAARAVLSSHAGELGTSLEHVARTFLRSFLPSEYGLGRGFVIWRPKGSTTTSVSTQLDIIIYDAVRGGAIADLETAQVYPIEQVYGYVEVKTVFLDHLDQTLRVSDRLRTPNTVLYTGRPQDLSYHLAPDERARMERSLQGVSVWNAIRSARVQRPRLLCWVFAFEGAREKQHGSIEGLESAFHAAWTDPATYATSESGATPEVSTSTPGTHAHIAGALVVDVRCKNKARHSALLCSVPDHSNPDVRRTQIGREDAAMMFKKSMLNNLSAFTRPPLGLWVGYEQYLVPDGTPQP